MSAASADEITMRDLRKRWAPASSKTVQRQIRRMSLRACRLVGTRPVFKLADVIDAERRMLEQINAALLGKERVLSTDEARFIASVTKKRRAKR